MYRRACRNFLEVGPGVALTGMVSAILQADATAFALDGSSGQRPAFRSGRRPGLAGGPRAMTFI